MLLANSVLASCDAEAAAELLLSHIPALQIQPRVIFRKPKGPEHPNGGYLRFRNGILDRYLHFLLGPLRRGVQEFMRSGRSPNLETPM